MFVRPRGTLQDGDCGQLLALETLSRMCRFRMSSSVRIDWTCNFSFGYGVEDRKCCGCAVRPLVPVCGRRSVKWFYLICESRCERVGEQSRRYMRRRWSGPILRVFSRDDDVAGARPRDARFVRGGSGEKSTSAVEVTVCRTDSVSVSCSCYTNSTVLCIPTPQRVFGRRKERGARENSFDSSSVRVASATRRVGFRRWFPRRETWLRTEGSVVLVERRASGLAPRSVGYRATGDGSSTLVSRRPT